MTRTTMTPPPDVRIDQCRHGLFASLKGDSHIGKSLEMYGEWSEGEIAVLTQILRAGDVVVDAGANIGAHAVPFAQKVGPKGRVFAFEPQPRIHGLLATNAFLNGIDHLTPIQAGLGAEHGFVDFPDRPARAGMNHGGVSLRPLMEAPTEAARRVRVPVGPLDEMLTLDRLRLIKADVEHMELDLIKGAANTIRRHQPVIFLENGDPEETDALVDAMAAFDYRGFWQIAPVFRPDNFRGETANPFGTQGCANILFAPKSFTVKNFTPVTGKASHPWLRAQAADPT